MSEGSLQDPLSEENDESEGSETPEIKEAPAELYEKLNTVLQVFSEFSEPSLGSSPFLECVLDRIKDVCEADLILFFSWKEAEQEWPLLYHNRLPKHIAKNGLVPRAWQSLPTIVSHEDPILVSDDISKDRRFIGQVIRGMRFRSFCGVTLRSEKKVFGSLIICHLDPDRVSDTEQKLLLALSKILIPFASQKETKPPVVEAVPEAEKIVVPASAPAPEVVVASPETLTSPSFSLSLDLSNRILSFDPCFAEFLGHKAERLQKAPISHFLSPAGRSAYSESLKKLKSKDREKILPPFEIEVLKKGGQKRILLVALERSEKEGKLSGMTLKAENATSVDVLEKELANDAVLTDMLRAILSSLDHFGEEEFFESAFNQITPLSNTDGAMLLRVNQEKKKKFNLVVQNGLEPAQLEQLEKQGIEQGDHVLLKMFEKKTLLVLNAKKKGTFLKKRQVGIEGLISYLAVPIESNDQLWGVFVVFSRNQPFSENESKLFGKIAREFAFALEKLRLFRSLQKEVKTLKTLNEAGNALSKSLHLEQVLSSITAFLKDLIGASNSYVFLVDDKRHLLVGAAASEQRSDSIRKFELKLNDNTFIPLSARERHPFVIENVSQDARVSKKWLKTFKSRSLLTIPLISKERVVGVAILDETRYFRKFTTEEIEKVMGMAAQVAVAIENATLYHSVSRHRERLQTLSSAIVNIQEEEHRRIAKKLREEAGEALISVRKEVSWLQEKLDRPSEEIKGRLIQMDKQMGDAAELLRVLSHGLRPAILDEAGLLSTIKWYLQEFAKQNTTKVHLQTNGVPKRFPARIEILLFRVIQEALSNIEEHSNSESAILSLEKREPYVHLYITDDGKGFDVKRYFSSPLVIRKGIGILGMKERIELAGGTFYIDSTPGKGTRISIRIPLVKRTTSN